jgi:hypothetical protein
MEGPVPQSRPNVSLREEPAQPDQATHKMQEKILPGKEKMEKKPIETFVPPPIEKENPVYLAACIAELKAIGADFTEAKPIDESNGCGIDRPLEVKSLGDGIKLVPPGTMRCRTAVNLARWTRDVVVPMLAKSQPKEALAQVDQASTYICRKRNNAETGKISEHAHGNAVDIAGFTFKSGKTFTIQPREEDSTLNGAFQRSIATAACLYFSTVLDPGSDKAHETHLHLDTLKRKGGYRYCW